MNDQREALIGRFRAGIKARVQSARSLLDQVNAGPDKRERSKQMLGELHTLKGEARMLGLVALADLTHALEAEFAGETDARAGGTGRAARAFDAILKALDQTAPESSDRLLEHALAELCGDEPGTLASVPAPGPAPGTGGERPLSEGRKARPPRWTQVDAVLVDELCERVAELAAAFGQLHEGTRSLVREAAGRGNSALVVERLESCKRLVDDSTSRAWALRLVPVEPTLTELGYHARSLAAALEKSIEVRVSAGGVQLERDVLDQLRESLLHLVQNAVDHGLEREGERGDKLAVGTLTLAAESVGPNVVFRVEDDGQGVDVGRVREAATARGLLAVGAAPEDDDLLELLFDHGFTTRAGVGQVSGRGVGLDVVRRRVESFGGSVKLATKPGHGTSFSLSVPFAITRERLLVVELADTLYGLPARVVRAVLGAADLDSQPLAAGARADKSRSRQRPDVIRHLDELLPARSLAGSLGLPPALEEPLWLVVELASRRWALSVPRIVGERNLIRRPAEPLLAKAGGLGGSALLDDGRVVLLLELNALQRAVRRVENGVPNEAALVGAEMPRRERVLVVDDSPVVRELVSEILASAGLEVEVAADGVAALEKVQQREPDLVLSDIEMPGMDGLGLLGEIRRQSQRLPVVILTTRASAEDRRRATALGANAYIVKSDFRSETLLDVVRRFVHVQS